jgi:hypothetical protein
MEPNIKQCLLPRLNLGYIAVTVSYDMEVSFHLSKPHKLVQDTHCLTKNKFKKKLSHHQRIFLLFFQAKHSAHPL